MANAYALNYPAPANSNTFSIVWKLTRTMKAAGWTYQASSNGTTKDTSGTAANDLWGGNVNPLLDAYPSLDAVNAWWVGRGPSTVKIPFTVASTGTFLRGETITQATSAAEGELVGYVFDATAVSGWLVVLPHTGTFDNTHVITGSTSGATLTPNGTVINYVREVVFGKTSASTVQGSIYYVCADVSGESASLFTTLAVSAGCTTSVWPGGGGSGNTFPAIAITILGTGGATSGTNYWFNNGNFGGANAQMATVNATPGTGVSADGSFYSVLLTAAQQVDGFLYTRVDDSEPGDVDPYVWIVPTSGNNNYTTWTRTVNTGGASHHFNLYFTLTGGGGGAGNSFVFGYQARGVAGRDVGCGYLINAQYSSGPSNYLFTDVGNLYLGAYRQVNHPAAVPPIILESLLVFTSGASSGTFKQYKGRTRWFKATSIGGTYGTLDNRNWLVVCQNQTSVPTNLILLAVGPLDGTSFISM